MWVTDPLQSPNRRYRPFEKNRCSSCTKLSFYHRSSNRNVRAILINSLNHVHGPLKPHSTIPTALRTPGKEPVLKALTHESFGILLYFVLT